MTAIRLGDRLPTGWYRLPPIEQLGPDRVAPWSALGVELVVWADGDGGLHAADAFCPHLGAHLGHGGTTDGEGNLTCPFHGWCFDAGGDRLGGPPAARLGLRPTAPADGAWYVFVDHRPGGDRAPWPPAALRRDGDAEPDHLEHLEVELPAHQQLVVEGEFDAGHFPLLHHRTFELVDSSFDGPRASARYVVRELDQEIDLELDGVSRMRLDVRWPGHRFLVVGDYVTVAHDRARAVGAIALWGDEPRTLPRVVRRVRRTQEEDQARDAVIWRHRAYEAPFLPGPDDGLLVAFRRWARQFYA